MNNTENKQVKLIEGTVTSVKNAKTATVSVIHMFRHPLYKKAIKRRRKFAAHVEGLEVAVGDKVRIREVKPVSKTKHFMVVSKVN